MAKYGLSSYAQAFQPCPNLQAGSRILNECYQRAGDWGRAFSCYYSGNFTTGYRHGYVQKVFASMSGSYKMTRVNGGIAVYGNAGRRVVQKTTYPAYDQSFDTKATEPSNSNIALNDPEPAQGAYMVTARNRAHVTNQLTQIDSQPNGAGQARTTLVKESDAASIAELRRRKDDAFVF